MKRIVVEAGGEIVQVRFTRWLEIFLKFPLLWQPFSLSVYPHRYVSKISWIEDSEIVDQEKQSICCETRVGS